MSRSAGGWPRCVWAALVAPFLFVALHAPLRAQSIDGFNAPFGSTISGATAGYPTTGPDIFGVERDFFLENLSTPELVTLSTINFPSEFQHLQSEAGLARTTLVWDGFDGNVSVLDPEGLGPADFTLQTKADAFVLEVSFLDRALDVPIRLHDSSGTEEIVLSIPGPVSSTTVWHIPFEDFGVVAGSNLDYISVGAVELLIDGSNEPGLHLRLGRLGVTPLVGSTKRDELSLDVDGDGRADPGDRIKYSVVVTNPSDAYGATSFGVLFESNAPSLTTLRSGSVTTSRGTVVLGNQANDASVRVLLGDMADGDTATIEFEVEVVDPIPAEAVEVTCQGLLSSSNLSDLPSDDPDVPGVTDPTTTPVGGTPALDASLVAVLEVDVDNDARVDPGDTLRYRLAASNVGDQGTTGVRVTVSPPTYGRLLTGSVSSTSGLVLTGNGATDNSVEVDVGTLVGRGGSSLVEYLVAIDEPLPVGIGSVMSQGSVASDDLAPEPTDDPDTVAALDSTVTPVETPTVLFDKSAERISGGSPTVPRIRYTLGIRNTGGATAFRVALRDDLEPRLALLPGTVAAGVEAFIVEGNAVDDDEVVVTYQRLLPGDRDTIQFDVEVVGLGTEAVTILNQAVASGQNFADVLSDDPRIGGDADPTAVSLRLSPVSIPALGGWSLGLLAFALGFCAVRLLSGWRLG